MGKMKNAMVIQLQDNADDRNIAGLARRIAKKRHISSATQTYRTLVVEEYERLFGVK